MSSYSFGLRPTEKMAATRVGNVTTFQKALNAFRGWYVYAAGYRQLGNIYILLIPICLN